MYGLIFAELRKYAEDRFGEGTWPELLHAAGVERQVFLNVNEYSDEEAVALLTALLMWLPCPFRRRTGTGVGEEESRSAEQLPR